MAIRITLECGHTSMLRARTTPEGYTHDWDLYVRGVDNADISQYIKKVVFQLHDTFSNPKRILKSPPYSLKESGYAGFLLPIFVYLKNNDEPKKIQIQYDLQLQESGPPINNVIRHSELFINPSDDFRRKLLKGGGVVVSSIEEGHDKSESKLSVPMVGKPKLSGSDAKKHRVIEPKTTAAFVDLFGTPVSITKVSPENKNKTGDKTSYQKLPPDKSDKNDNKANKTKHSPHKDGKRDKSNGEEKEKKDKKGKDVTRDKERSKEKSKRPPSPVNSKNSHPSPSSKRPPSPGVAAVKKQQLSPPESGTTVKSSSPKIREKDHKKLVTEKPSSKDKDKVKEAPKSTAGGGGAGASAGSLEELKNDKKKKKYKDDKDSERKDKAREKDRDKVKEPKSSDSKKSLDKLDKHDKVEKDSKVQESKQLKDVKKSPKPVKDDRSSSKSRSDKSEVVDKVEKVKDARSDKDRQKHKHRKKEKKERTDDSRERERRDKRDKQKNYDKDSVAVTSNPPQTNSSSTADTHDRDNSSDSANSADEEDSKTLTSCKNEQETVRNTGGSESRPARPLSPGSDHVKRERPDKVKKDKLKPVRGSSAGTGSAAAGGGAGGAGGNTGTDDQRDNRKRKRRSDSKGEDEAPAVKREKDTGFSPPLEPVSSSQSPVTVEVTAGYPAVKELPEEMETAKQEFEHETEQIAPDSTNSVLIESETDEPLVFSEDYVSQLKDLQQKIMTLQDNQELQRVVQVIAATGQYEITRKTFDFDLCALDRRTVQRLQQFFSAS
ncbi:protein AF-9 [Microplitis mediator]|uniref:protein AF-9 n=1 Tax=Microplitis mediator TaxID=375433 RepID=UPI002552E6C1|nr:protein AF-9 [Microplitis mediator]XP_057338117.1 protein AF-9 [Microplitis mediator]